MIIKVEPRVGRIAIEVGMAVAPKVLFYLYCFSNDVWRQMEDCGR